MTKPCSAGGTVYTCELTAADGSKTLAVWDTAMSCVSGLCSTSAFSVPSGYSSYLDLANVSRTLKSGTLHIGAKPLLLLPRIRRADWKP